MTQQTLEALAQQAAAGDKAASETLIRHIESIFRQLDKDTLDQILHAVQDLQRGADQPRGLPSMPITPELIDWARRQFTEQELTEALRDLRENGGIELPELLQGIEPRTDSP